MSSVYNLNPAPSQQPPQSRGAKTPVSVAATTTPVVALPANANRANWSLFNAGPGTIFMREGTTVAANLYEKQIPAGFFFDSEPSFYGYTGAVALMTESGTATVMVSESTIP